MLYRETLLEIFSSYSLATEISRKRLASLFNPKLERGELHAYEFPRSDVIIYLILSITLRTDE